jgi:superfamily I DNA and/or RNA helicase
VLSPLSLRANYSRSLMERLMEEGYPSLVLDMQYRMHPHICDFPNRTFYEERLLNAPNVLEPRVWHSKAIVPSAAPSFPPSPFFDFRGREGQDSQGSSRNEPEAAVVLELLKTFLAAHRSLCDASSIGIITPYNAQVRLIEELLETGRDTPSGVEVRTIDGFQGREKDVIIVSTVRCNASVDVGFLRDARRLNVCVTRARFSLWVVGDSTTLRGVPEWDALIQDAKRRKCLVDLNGMFQLPAWFVKEGRSIKLQMLKQGAGVINYEGFHVSSQIQSCVVPCFA